MTDLVKKEKVAGIICYLAYSAILIYQNHNLFSLVYFAAVAIVIFIADKLFAENTPVKKTLTAFFVTAVGYQAMFGIFRSVHNDFKQILTAAAVAIFFACIFALTDKKKFLFGIAAAPILCFLNLKIAICYCIVLLCFSIIKMSSSEDVAANKKKTKNKIELSPKKLAVAAIIISTVCFGISVYLLATSDAYVKENLNYLLQQFKNPPALIIASIYLAVRLFRNSAVSKAALGSCVFLSVAAATVTTVLFGWSLFAVFCLSIPLMLAVVCLDNTATVNLIKADYEHHKLIFWVIIICALQ